MTPVDDRPILDLVARVRSRWRRLGWLRASVRASLAVSAVLALALFFAYWTPQAPLAMAAIGVAATLVAATALIWGLWPARDMPSDARVARFIEESDSSLDDRLASAVDLSRVEGQAPGFAEHLVADAARVASQVDPARVVLPERLRRAWFQAAGAAMLLVAVAFFGRNTARESFDALAMTLFPAHVTLDVTPGNARIRIGSPLTIEARLVGNRAPVVAQVLRADASGPASVGAASHHDVEWRGTDMTNDSPGAFTLALGPVTRSFKYRVAAGAVTSPVYDVVVAQPPRVTRIDVEYLYPPSFGLEPRVEEDGGDIYAPAGTDVRLRVHTDREAASGQMALAGGTAIGLTTAGENVLGATLRVTEDSSYRIGLADREGLKNPGETEYFIRTLEDRPPEVRVLRPARDRSVTPLEEIEVEAQAEDDFGVERLELVYALRGGAEKVVPLAIPRRSVSVTGAHTLYLEDLRVQPGDFVSYYVRARDLPRGRRSSETRSDIFFLEVKPFEQEFALAQSQSMMGGGGGNRSVDDLVAAQKEVIVATWKLDRRSQAASGAKSEQDIKSVARAEAELKTRVEQTSSSFRESTMRDPRRLPQPPRPGGRPPDTLRAGQTLPEEDAMTSAAAAMGRAVDSLNALKTAPALPPEMDALNHLLKAQADVKKRQVSRQQAGSGAGSNRTTQDLSSLFDKELLRQQQTNYETPTSTEQRETPDSMIDKIKELAQRQDELLRRQQELARARAGMTPEALKRELEKLTREQSELRQRAEELARQLGRQQQNQAGQQAGQQSGQQPGQQNGSASSQQNQRGQPTQSGQQGGQGQSGQGAAGDDASQQMRAVSEEMRNAASELRREDPRQASARGSRALEQLRDLQRRLQTGAPDERRRALGEMQLEARQLADAQRQVASELSRVGPGGAGHDSLRRLAGEQERLADRAKRLQQGLGQQAAAPDNPKDRSSAKNIRQSASEASREIDRQKIPDRMRQSADELRSAAGQADGTSVRNAAKSTAAAQEDVARALDRLADKLSIGDAPADGESRRLTEQLARAQELRERIDTLTREVERLAETSNDSAAPNGQRTPSPGGRSGQAQNGPGTGGSDVSRLRDEYNRQLQETRRLLDELGREDATFARGGVGFTFEGQGMVLSAPGTEAFKQDFSKWDQLRKQATQALERAQSSLSQKLQARQSSDRLAAGVEDKAPASYQQQVDNYFKALAEKKKP